MRKVLKKQITNLLATLQNAHGEILQAIDMGNYDVAGQLLGDCQNAAIQIGTIIEESEGEGFVTVGMLEDYCELIYQIHTNLPPENARQELSNKGEPQSEPGFAQNMLDSHKSQVMQGTVNTRKLQKVLQKHVIRIENSIKNDITVRTEAVFLPYKASMWDSLESVWTAANGDPDCDAYVVPIPYYDKNPDGTFGELHDESSLYPDYVPIMDYHDYDFEGRQPDIIFIHNPYDNTNYVTSVHPFFYSENLKNFTECLVYIPYFIEKEFEPGDEHAMQHMEHFVLNPGVVRANYVVVQSEAMRQIYIDILTRHSGETTRNFWEERVLGLGSPKMDRVQTTKEEDFEIPENWKTHLYKDDNSRRKVIFYNTSIGAFLQHGEQMLEKIQDVLQIFWQERENIVLLWRPHPLLPTTIQSMRPELYEAYEKIVEEYRTRDWGIYDDSADLNRAIAVSDAYYGDPSSVVELFRTVGKPVMIQNVSVQNSINTFDLIIKKTESNAKDNGGNL